MERYSALIIDLKKSKSYDQIDRIDIQNFTKSIILLLNKIFSNVLELDVVFSAGDEVQGLFSSTKSAYLYFRLFNMLIYPVAIRAGIGVGEWNVKVEGKISTEQDGTAYYNARNAIEKVDDSLGNSVLLYSEGKDDIYINTTINAATVLVSNRSMYQNELSLLSELLYPINIDNAIKTNYFNELSQLITQKYKVKYFARKKSIQSIRNYPIEVMYDFIFDCNPVNALTDEKQFYSTSGRVKGLPTKLAKILKTSRQSIEKSIKSGHIYQERNFTIIALKLMNKYIPGG
jgi:hypothetical protein